MNELPRRILLEPATTQAADGMPRRPWTRSEIEAMVKAGILDEDERFELIGGEVVPMSPKGARHELVKMEINRHLLTSALSGLNIIPETTLWLDETTFVEPDFCIWPREIAPGSQRGHDVLLVVEVADTSLRYDLGRKIAIYAAYGIPEVWVVDADTLVTHVFRKLGAEGFRERLQMNPVDTVSASLVPDIAMNLAGLGLRPA